ncbi:MAG: hypothetical protein ACE5HT_12180 [Gemmatimonadales bacterium]
MAMSLAVMDRQDRFESPALLTRARSGEPEALAQLYERFGRVVYGIALKQTKSRDEISR